MTIAQTGKPDIVAQVRSERTLARFLPWQRDAQDFEPAGERGWGNRIASRYWGLTPQEYFDAADLWPLDPDGNILLIGIVEEAEGVQNIRDILRQVRGIGAIWAGAGDMSVSMGLRGQASHPAVQENLLRV